MKKRYDYIYVIYRVVDNISESVLGRMLEVKEIRKVKVCSVCGRVLR